MWLQIAETRSIWSLEFFASWIGRSKMQRTALGFPYAENLEMDNSLKWILFNIVSGKITSEQMKFDYHTVS